MCINSTVLIELNYKKHKESSIYCRLCHLIFISSVYTYSFHYLGLIYRNLLSPIYLIPFETAPIRFLSKLLPLKCPHNEYLSYY